MQRPADCYVCSPAFAGERQDVIPLSSDRKRSRKITAPCRMSSPRCGLRVLRPDVVRDSERLADRGAVNRSHATWRRDPRSWRRGALRRQRSLLPEQPWFHHGITRVPPAERAPCSLRRPSRGGRRPIFNGTRRPRKCPALCYDDLARSRVNACLVIQLCRFAVRQRRSHDPQRLARGQS